MKSHPRSITLRNDSVGIEIGLKYKNFRIIGSIDSFGKTAPLVKSWDNVMKSEIKKATKLSLESDDISKPENN